MTLMTLIVVNAVLGAAVTYGIVWLLGVGIRTDRARLEPQARPFEQRAADRLAA